MTQPVSYHIYEVERMVDVVLSDHTHCATELCTAAWLIVNIIMQTSHRSCFYSSAQTGTQLIFFELQDEGSYTVRTRRPYIHDTQVS